MPRPGRNPTPLTAAQLRALLHAVTRELLRGLREVTREMRSWRAKSASLVVLLLLTLAAQRNLRSCDVEQACLVYWPWMNLVAVMLDSYADQAEDAVAKDHSYVAHYPSRAIRIRRLSECIRRASAGALTLADGHSHAIIASSMVAMYLSKDSVRVPSMASETRALAKAGGSLARLLMPVLRLWRAAYSHRAA